jgi:nucleotide-binding universal stress UspA family protein
MSEKKKKSISRGQNRPVASGFKKVLVAFDGSDHAMKAFTAAEEQAKKHGAELIVLSVVELPVPYLVPKIAPVEISAVREFVRKDAEAQVDKLARQAKDNGVNARGKVLDKGGSTVKLIVEYAEEEGVDLIVVGTRGLGGFRKMLLGSVSSGLVSHAHCQVLIVR